jgi:hypothetical protein
MVSQVKLLSDQDCNDLINLFHERHSDTFRLDWKTERDNLDTDRRQRLYLFPRSDKLYQSLCDKILRYSPEGYIIEIFIAQYVKGEGVDWHTDFPFYEKQPPYDNKRHNNFSILLTNDFEGGILEIDNESVDTPVGVATFFDTSFDHRVTRVTSGTRYSLIGWIYM